MLKGLGDIGHLMKLQKDLKDAQKRIQKMNAEGDSGSGEVKCVINGEFKLVQLYIDEEFYAKSDRKTVQNMVVQSINDAYKNIKALSAEEMKKLTGGMDIPGLGGMFG